MKVYLTESGENVPAFFLTPVRESATGDKLTYSLTLNKLLDFRRCNVGMLHIISLI